MNIFKEFEKLIDKMIKEEVEKKHSSTAEELSFDRSGFAWSKAEEDYLIREVIFSIDKIAIRHQRSFTAIKSRIEQLIREDRLCDLRGLPRVRSDRFQRTKEGRLC